MDRSSHSLSFSPSCSPFPTYTAAFQATVKPIQKGIRIHFHWKHFVLSYHLLLYQPPNPHMPFLWSLVSHIWKPRIFGHCVLQRSLRELLFFTSNSPLKTCAYAYGPNSLDNINLNVFFFSLCQCQINSKDPSCASDTHFHCFYGKRAYSIPRSFSRSRYAFAAGGSSLSSPASPEPLFFFYQGSKGWFSANTWWRVSPS